MEIAIVSGGMPTGPSTLEHYSLGGSETAALSIAKELKARGHLVNLFCNLPPEGRLDHVQSGTIGPDGVRYVDIRAASNFLMATEIDLLVVSRLPEIMQIPHQARKAVLWMHDLATYSRNDGLHGTAWVFDEIWCVSEYHRQQIHKVTGYPIDKIWATRNGITRWEVTQSDIPPAKDLLYAARPERGLEHLIRPGGIMERLPDFHLTVCTYDNFPESMKDYYGAIFSRCLEMKNVTVLPPQTQKQLRQLMEGSFAYVYPTNFEEVSCIIARECIEQHLPFITPAVGALPETLGESGIIYDCPRASIGTDAFCEGFAGLIRSTYSEGNAAAKAKQAARSRTDLYWDSIAAEWESRAEVAAPSLYTHVRSLIEDSDIIPAIALLESAPAIQKTAGVRFLESQIQEFYPYLFGRESFHDYYARYYIGEDEKGARGKPQMDGNQRFEAIAQEIAELPAGTRVLDYGCAEGVICNTLARRNPDKTFVAVDFNDGNIRLAAQYAKEDGLANIEFHYIKETDEIGALGGGFGAAICSEVLEHVTEPWNLIDRLEQECLKGAKVVITVPAGPWEATGLYNKKQFPWRAHIWHVNKFMARTMFAEKANVRLSSMFQSVWDDGRTIGHTTIVFDVSDAKSVPMDPLEKAFHHRHRDTIAAAIIAYNAESDIRRCLDSISRQVHQVQIALGPCTDGTLRSINEWQEDNRWCEVRVKNVPKIEPRKFGFDDARNASLEDLEADWVLWIDTDEYLSGSIKRYVRGNAYDSYAIHQHHFTVNPRGAPAQLDKPARLFRNNGTFNFYGKVHEHAEKGFNSGPGHTMVLPDVDIGHIGYVNEEVRKDRFNRNFPFLQWDREVYPDRKLGMFLWLRDLIHIMRFHAGNNDMFNARHVATEAISFYEANAEKFEFIGGGIQQSFDYVSEARSLLGIGTHLGIRIENPNEKIQMGYQGIFTGADETLRFAQRFLKDEFERRTSGYWK